MIELKDFSSAPKDISLRVHKNHRVTVITKTMSESGRNVWGTNNTTFEYPNSSFIVSHLDQILPEGVEKGYKSELAEYLSDLFEDPEILHVEFFPSYSMVVTYTNGGSCEYPLYWYAWTDTGFNYLEQAMKREEKRNECRESLGLGRRSNYE